MCQDHLKQNFRQIIEKIWDQEFPLKYNMLSTSLSAS